METYEFFFDQMHSLPIVQKSMFGVKSYYLRPKIILAVSTSEKWPEDIGIWVVAPLEHQDKLLPLLKEYRPIKRIGTKKWLLIPEDSDTFEEDASTIAELINGKSLWIGTIPKPKKKKTKSNK